MVRVKQLAALQHNLNLYPSESSYFNSTETYRMARKRKNDVIIQAKTLFMGPRVALRLDDGSWWKIEYLFVKKGDEIGGGEVFWDLS